MPYRIKILIVEDHVPTAGALARLLDREDSMVQSRIVGTLAEALRESREWCPDVTLLDLCLPDSPGWQSTVEAIPRFKPPVIVVSDLVDEEVRVAARKAGAENVFKKQTVLSVASILLRAAASAASRREAVST
jgi:DNA-binding response OmpR family regulator